jgi:hypothetical protein
MSLKALACQVEAHEFQGMSEIAIAKRSGINKGPVACSIVNNMHKNMHADVALMVSV